MDKQFIFISRINTSTHTHPVAYLWIWSPDVFSNISNKAHH